MYCGLFTVCPLVGVICRGPGQAGLAVYRLVYWTDLYQARAKQGGPGGLQPGLFRSKLANTNIAERAPAPARTRVPDHLVTERCAATPG